jgi:glycosyltransferase involved in cell wall biosynthesis
MQRGICWNLTESARENIIAVLSRVSRIFVHRIADLNLLKELGLCTNVTLFPHGAALPTSVPPARSFTQRRQPVIGCHGFFLPGKGIPRLIEVVARLRQEWPLLRLRLINAEYPVPESVAEIARCRMLADSLGLADAIEWNTKFQPHDECIRSLSSCDLLVLPYDPTVESASGALRGALSSGVPTAVTPIALFDEAREAVYRFTGLDTASVQNGVELLLRDSQMRTGLQCAASAWLSERDWRRLAERMLGMIAGLYVAKTI